MEQQPSDLTLILSKLDTIQRTLHAYKTSTNERLARIEAGQTLIMKQWKRLSTKTAELDDDVQELAALTASATPPPIPVSLSAEPEE